MSFFKFVTYFVVGLVGTSFLVSAVKNPFLVGFIVGILLGVIGARD